MRFLFTILSALILAVSTTSGQLPQMRNDRLAEPEFLQNERKVQSVAFEENKGQIKDQHWKPRPDVLFNGTSQSINFYVRNSGLSYQMSRVERWKAEDEDLPIGQGRRAQQIPDEIGSYRVDVNWIDHSSALRVERGAELPGYNNYYNVPEDVEPALYVKKYDAITVQDVWPGIDLYCSGANGMLETDWLLAPGADHTRIRMEIKGAELSIDAEGFLVMHTPFGDIREGRLKVFQNGAELSSSWNIERQEEKLWTVGFHVPDANPLFAMRIDPPTIVWGTYFGQSSSIQGCHVNADGTISTVGSTYSNTLMATVGAHQTTNLGESDAFLSKFSTNGQLLWSTYYGGPGTDWGEECSALINGDIVIGGASQSSINISTLGAFQETMNGIEDGFYAKFNSAGVRVWASYFGDGGTTNGVSGVSGDSFGNVYVVAGGCSGNDLSTAGAHQTQANGLVSPVLMKLDSDGNRIWATYYGGSESDGGNGCHVDASDHIYLYGYTRSPNGIATPNSFQDTISSNGSNDGFVAKFNADGVRIWGTYFGGNNDEGVSACATDDQGNVFVVGTTNSPFNDFIMPDAYQPIQGGSSDGFIGKLDQNGGLIWNTFLGGPLEDCLNDCHVNSQGDVIVVGYVFSDSMSTGLAFQSQQSGIRDAFISLLTAEGELEWATYYGGTDDDLAFGTAFLNDFEIVVAGNSLSSTSIATPNANQPAFIAAGSGIPMTGNATLAKFRLPKVSGRVFLDYDSNCTQGQGEDPINFSVPLVVQPGGIVTQTSTNGYWFIDELPVGSYTVTIDTNMANWMPSCASVQSFTVDSTTGPTLAPSFGVVSNNPCPDLEISLAAPLLRRGAYTGSHVSVCNNQQGTDVFSGGHVIVHFDDHLSIGTASLPYTALGNNDYRFLIPDLYPGDCINLSFQIMTSLSAMTGQTQCLSAELFPQPNCLFSVSNPLTPCSTPWDNSEVSVTTLCDGDTVRFNVVNTGGNPTGDMECYSPVSVFLDGEQIALDSVQLNGGASQTFSFLGEARTWRLEVEQHPWHPGESHPSATIENCGTGTWIPNIYNQLPMNDADPVIDIFCGQVIAPSDPNDKTGFPLGVGPEHHIAQNQRIEYMVRFQNIGTDTAFNILILDTLDTDLNIFSVVSGVSSHQYQFRMYGPRVLEWKFTNIQLPDSTTNEAASHGFVMFQVDQVPDLPFSTVIENTANIYFDFEAPVITNTYFHTVHNFSFNGIVTGDIETTTNGLSVFPNPTTGLITVQTNFKKIVSDVKVTNLHGQPVPIRYEFIENSRHLLRLDLGSCSAGIYILHVLTEEEPNLVLLVKY